MKISLAGRSALVTGGTRGVGRAIAESLQAAGAQVVVSGMSEESCLAATADLAGRIDVVRADARSLSDTAALIDQTLTRLGGLDILVNNAGQFAGGSLGKLGDQEWYEAVDTKVFGAIRTTRAALPSLISGNGVVLNIAGGSAHLASGNAAISGVNNAGMIAFTSYLTREYGPQGMRACALSPGMTLTESWRTRAADLSNTRGITTDEALEQLLNNQGFGHARWLRPEELGELATFLVSDYGSAVNGSTIRADAGQSTVVG